MRLGKLDILFSEYIRRRAISRVGGCEKCLTPKHEILKDNGDIFPAWKHLDAAHCFGRARRSVRWDEDDAAGLCGACHFLIDGQHDIKEALFRKLLGDDGYNHLMIRANTPQKPDKEAIRLYLTEKLKGGK